MDQKWLPVVNSTHERKIISRLSNILIPGAGNLRNRTKTQFNARRLHTATRESRWAGEMFKPFDYEFNSGLALVV